MQEQHRPKEIARHRCGDVSLTVSVERAPVELVYIHISVLVYIPDINTRKSTHVCTHAYTHARTHIRTHKHICITRTVVIAYTCARE